MNGVSKTRAVIYALPALALAVPLIPAAVYLPAFYAEHTGVGLSAVGLALFAARTLDVISDPVAGALSDRTRSRFGRRKPWVLAGGLVAGPALVFLFTPPEDAGWAYLLCWSAALYTGWTMISVPYWAWAAEAARSYTARASLNAWREGFGLAGILLAGAVPAAAAAFWGAGLAESLSALAYVTVALAVPAFALLALKMPDPPPEEPPLPRRPLKESLGALWSNGPFKRLLSAWFINGLANGLPAALFPLYLAHGLGAGETETAALIFIYFVSGAVFMPVWPRLGARIGKHRAWCWAMAAAVAAFMWVPFLEPGAVAAFSVICVVTGAALGADLSLPPAMQADVIDYAHWRDGAARAGTFFAVWSMASKLALALAVGAAFPALDAFGFSETGANTKTALTALAVIYAGVPCALKIAAIAAVWGHPVTARRLRAVQSRIARRSRKPDQAFIRPPRGAG